MLVSSCGVHSSEFILATTFTTEHYGATMELVYPGYSHGQLINMTIPVASGSWAEVAALEQGATTAMVLTVTAQDT